jgi:uncharacterized protein with beta-barrel porin domain
MKNPLFIGAILLLALSLTAPVFAGEVVTTSSSQNDFGGLGIWSTTGGGHANQKENKGYKASLDNEVVTAAGFDKIVNPHVRLGSSFGYGFSDVNYKQNRTGWGSYGVDDNAFSVVGTATYDSINLCESRKNGKYSPEAVRNQGINGWYVDSALGFTQHNYDLRTERFNLALAPNMQVGKGDDHGQEYFVGTEAAYIYNTGKDNTVHVTPFTSLTYDQLYQNVLKVKGLGVNDYKIKEGGSTSLEQGFGVKLAKSLVSEKMGTFIPYVKGEWLIDYIHDIQSHNRDRAAGVFGAGLIFLSKGRMTVSGNWDMEVRNRLLENTGYGKIRYDF